MQVTMMPHRPVDPLASMETVMSAEEMINPLQRRFHDHRSIEPCLIDS
jgi:hypothetical protein